MHIVSYPQRLSYSPIPQPSVSLSICLWAKFSQLASTALNRQDPFHCHEQTAKLCTCFIMYLFACPESPFLVQLDTRTTHFIAYALNTTKLYASVTFALPLAAAQGSFSDCSEIFGHLRRHSL